MALFNFGKKKEETEKPVCSCSCDCQTTETESSTCCCSNSGEAACSIKVLGSGCKNCHDLYENTQEAVKNIGFDAQVEYVTDMQKVMEYGVMSMPGLVVNEKVVSMGRVLKTADIEKLLHKLGF